MGVHNTQYEVNPENNNEDDDDNDTDDLHNITEASSMLDDSNADHVSIRSKMQRSKSIVNLKKPIISLNKPKTQSRRLRVSRIVGPESYYLGIIDYLQKWNFQKKV